MSNDEAKNSNLYGKHKEPQFISDNDGIGDSEKEENDNNYHDHDSDDCDKMIAKCKIHFIFLVHGYMGNEMGLSVIESAIRKQMTTSQDVKLLVYTPKCNVNKTHDGIEAGADRLISECSQFIQSRVFTVDYVNNEDDVVMYASLNFVCHSLGGLYTRCALANFPMSHYLSRGEENDSSISSYDNSYECNWIKLELIPNVFVTTVTPHLGCASNTYIPIPRFLEKGIGNVLGKTGRDLFNVDPIVATMGTSPEYLLPLSRFKKRVAYINAFQSDFLVPPATAGFLSSHSTYLHQLLYPRPITQQPSTNLISMEYTTQQVGQNGTGSEDDNDDHFPDPVVAILRTRPNYDILKNGYFSSSNYNNEVEASINSMSVMLDSLGWDKIFLDLRPQIPTLRGSLQFKVKKSTSNYHMFHNKNRNSREIGGAKINTNNSRSRIQSNTTKDKKKKNKKMSSRQKWQQFLSERYEEHLSNCQKRYNNNNNTETKEERTDTTSDIRHPNKMLIMSNELKQYLTESEALHVPRAHQVIVANSKNEYAANVNAVGKPVVNYLVSELIKDILYYTFMKDG